MIGTMLPTRAGRPNDWGKDDYREQKKDASDLEPYNAASAAEGTKEAANALANTAAGLGCGMC